MSNFERLCKIYKKEKKPKDSKEVIAIQTMLLEKKRKEVTEKRQKELKHEATREAIRKQKKEYYNRNREAIKLKSLTLYHAKQKFDEDYISKKSKYRIINKDKNILYHKKYDVKYYYKHGRDICKKNRIIYRFRTFVKKAFKKYCQ
jgi:hypothetical protein